MVGNGRVEGDGRAAVDRIHFFGVKGGKSVSKG